MANDFFSASGNPATGSQGSSAAMRAEFDSIEDGFDKLPTMTGNGSKIVAVNSGGTALEPLTTTGSGNAVRATSPTLVTPILGTPQSGTLTSCTGLPISTGVSGLGTSVATALAVNVGSVGAVVTNGGALGTPSSGTLTNCGSLPISGISGLGTNVGTALAVNVGSSGAFVTNGGALGTPSSGTVTNLTGTASININGTVGATTPSTGVFTKVTVDDADFNLDIATADTPRITFSSNSYIQHTRLSNSTEFWNNGIVPFLVMDIGVFVQNVPLTVSGAVTATGVFTGPNGSASAPTYSFSSSGNSDNGMYLSAADTVAIASAGALASSLKHTPNNTTLFKIVDATTGTTSKTEVELTAGSALANFLLRNSSHTSYPGSLFITCSGDYVGIGPKNNASFSIGETQVYALNGTEGLPGYAFQDSTAGIYLHDLNGAISFSLSGARKFSIRGDRVTFASAFHVSSATATGTTPALQSGVYTPTITNAINVTSSTAKACQWMRVGNVVTVSGVCEIDPTSGGGTLSVIDLTLPIATSITLDTQLGGAGVRFGMNETEPILIYNVSQKARFSFRANDTDLLAASFSFTYLIT